MRVLNPRPQPTIKGVRLSSKDIASLPPPLLDPGRQRFRVLAGESGRLGVWRNATNLWIWSSSVSKGSPPASRTAMSRRSYWMNFAWGALAPPVEIFGTEAKPRGPLEAAQRRWRSQMPGSTAPGVSTSLGTMAIQPGSTRSRTCVVGPKAKTIRASESQLDVNEVVFARAQILIDPILRRGAPVETWASL